jgi:Flp pilus assembly protein protease CpaA
VTVGMLAATATLALALVLPTWLAALIVGIVCAVIGGVLALIGVRALRSASDEITTTLVQRIREDVQWLKHRMKPGSV